MCIFVRALFPMLLCYDIPKNVIGQFQLWPWSNISYDVPGRTPVRGYQIVLVNNLRVERPYLFSV